VSRHESSGAEAEAALRQWTRDPAGLDTAADACARRDTVELLHHASDAARRAA